MKILELSSTNLEIKYINNWLAFLYSATGSSSSANESSRVHVQVGMRRF